TLLFALDVHQQGTLTLRIRSILPPSASTLSMRADVGLDFLQRFVIANLFVSMQDKSRVLDDSEIDVRQGDASRSFAWVDENRQVSSLSDLLARLLPRCAGA
ncbi:unnamed protein product, partial [Symbiodinium sp. CCMP2456]